MKYTFAFALFMLFAASCKKSEDTPVNPVRTWTVGATTHNVNNYTKTGGMLYAYDKEFNGISFSFGTYPTADGTYTIVGNVPSLGAGEVSVAVFGFNSGTTYFSTGNDHTTATVSVTGTQVKITMPDTWAKKANTDDSVKISANLNPL